MRVGIREIFTYQSITRIAHHEDFSRLPESRRAGESGWKIAESTVHVSGPQQFAQPAVILPVRHAQAAFKKRSCNIDELYTVHSGQCADNAVQDGTARFADAKNEIGFLPFVIRHFEFRGVAIADNGHS